MSANHKLSSLAFRWAKFAAWDVFRALVLIPATTVGTLILVLTLFGVKPVSSFMESIYENRDKVGDIAGDGLISTRICLDRPPKFDEMPRPIQACKNYGTESVTIAKAVESNIGLLVMLYIVSAIWGFLVLSVIGAWQRYEPAPESYQ